MTIITGLSAEPLDTNELTGRIRRDDCGATVVFEGSTRSPDVGRVVTSLQYEAYEARAERQLRELAEEAATRFGVLGIVAMHRTGDVPPGDVSVLVACAAPHRAEAFEAARWLIDTIKETVAVWKKELSDDGEAWVGIPGDRRR